MKKPTTKYLQLPFQFDAKKLQQDLKTISNGDWSPMLYKHNYNGDWNSVALYAPDGNVENIFSHSDSQADLKPTVLLDTCQYLHEVIQSFQATVLSARLLRLTVGSVIKPHEDFKMGYEDGNCRIHIPITTNDHVSFVLDNERLILLPGTCWYINANFTHAVSNLGTEDRVHLVIDLERNDWTDNLFFSLASEESFALQKEEHSQEALQSMISELEKLNNDAVKGLIEEYKSRLIS